MNHSLLLFCLLPFLILCFTFTIECRGGFRGSSGARSGSRSGARSGSRSRTNYQSTNRNSRQSVRYVSRNVGTQRFNSFMVGAAVGYMVAGSHRRYYYHRSGYTGNKEFGESICTVNVNESMLNTTKNDGNTTVEATELPKTVALYWQCAEHQKCCDMDCCPSNKNNLLVIIAFAVLISLFVLLLCALLACAGNAQPGNRKRGCCRPNKGKRGPIGPQPPPPYYVAPPYPGPPMEPIKPMAYQPGYAAYNSNQANVYPASQYYQPQQLGAYVGQT